ncbi:MAG: hypothetical protein DMF64_01335 [Acidobacteria bacterium]|nr:MAG: hypothetical protein DMF64_01335 [Acidobacteriota bacterium]
MTEPNVTTDNAPSYALQTGSGHHLFLLPSNLETQTAPQNRIKDPSSKRVMVKPIILGKGFITQAVFGQAVLAE